MMASAPLRHAHPSFLRTAAIAVALAACSIESVLPAPDCAEGGSAIIAAQSVSTATFVPCFSDLPDGWSVDSVSINQERTIVRFDSDRAGEGAAQLRYTAECDLSQAVSSRSQIQGVDRWDAVERVTPGYRADTHFVFDGGCATLHFDFDNGVSATESVAVTDALELLSRSDFNDSLRETFIDEDL